MTDPAETRRVDRADRVRHRHPRGDARASRVVDPGQAVTWTDSAGNVEALTVPPGGAFGPGTVVGAGPFLGLTVIPGEAVLSIGAGLSSERVK